MALKKLEGRVAYLDGTTDTAVIRPSLIVWFEKVHKTPLAKVGDDYEKVCLIVYEALRRKYPDKIFPDLGTWIDTLEAIETDNVDVIPFVEALSNATSPPSLASPGSQSQS
jgi:hypothetical protein